jgi:hypothetical protein
MKKTKRLDKTQKDDLEALKELPPEDKHDLLLLAAGMSIAKGLMTTEE